MNISDWLEQNKLDIDKDLSVYQHCEPFKTQSFYDDENYKSLDIPFNQNKASFGIGINLDLNDIERIKYALNLGVSALNFKSGKLNLKDLDFIDHNLLRCFYNQQNWSTDLLKKVNSNDALFFLPHQLGLEHPNVSLGFSSYDLILKGANKTLELAYLLYQVKKSGLQDNLHFVFYNDNDFFLDVAKIRAFRFLIDELIPGISPYIHIEFHPKYYCINETSTNILRQTSAVFAALSADTNSFSLYDYTYRMPKNSIDTYRNPITLQWILKEESHLGETLDPFRGSYFLETLTYDLAQAAWSSLEKMLNNQYDFDNELKSINSKRKVKLIGTNLFNDANLIKSNPDFLDYEVIK